MCVLINALPVRATQPARARGTTKRARHVCHLQAVTTPGHRVIRGVAQKVNSSQQQRLYIVFCLKHEKTKGSVFSLTPRDCFLLRGKLCSDTV